MTETNERLQALTRDDELDADRDRRINEAVDLFVAKLQPEGVPLRDAVAVVAAQGFSMSILSEALSRLLYAGRVEMTEDRRLLPG